MAASSEPFVTYLELRESTAEGEAGAGLSHKSAGLVLLHVLELAAYGEPRGAVTIVHDAGEHGARYLDLAGHLARNGWSIALPDLRGHGRSEGDRGHSNGIKEVVRDIGDVQDHLAYRQPDAPRVLIGQGLGALYALMYASERPDGIAALVLAAPLLDPRFELPIASGGFMKLLKKVGPRSPGRIGYSLDALTSDPTAQQARARDELVHDVITLRAGEQAVEAAREAAQRLAQLAMPVLVVQGGADRIASSDRARALARPGVEVDVFDEARHDMFHESRATAIFDRVSTWLDAKLPR
jgi:alpha-beta hydrolase superfamily lysophospholipase